MYYIRMRVTVSAELKTRILFSRLVRYSWPDVWGGRYEDFGDSFDGSSTTVPQGVEFIPGLAAALAGAEIVNKN